MAKVRARHMNLVGMKIAGIRHPSFDVQCWGQNDVAHAQCVLSCVPTQPDRVVGDTADLNVFLWLCLLCETCTG